MGGPTVIHLPDGQNFTVTPVFAGLFFKSNELNNHHTGFPIGWTIVLNTEDGEDRHEEEVVDGPAAQTLTSSSIAAKAESSPHIHSYRRPTLQNDNIFISSISNPPASDFKPSPSPTRQIALMLWVSLYWYFHQPEPSMTLHTDASRGTPEAGKPRGEWRINVKRDGVLRGRNLIPKLERMGLLASYDSAVGTTVEDSSDGWSRMFVSRRMFWQIPGRLFLFTLQPNVRHPVSSIPGSPAPSRPTSPARREEDGKAQAAVGSPAVVSGATSSPSLLLEGGYHVVVPKTQSPPPVGGAVSSLVSQASFPIGPYFSSSHLPTYYPPPPPIYTVTNNVRHPLRPKPPRMGEVFYTRFVPSAGQYLAFRVASLSERPVPYFGPSMGLGVGGSTKVGGTGLGSAADEQLAQQLIGMTDNQLLRRWFANPRVRKFWGGYQDDMLATALKSRHSFPAVGLWDGVPFGYFEVYWVREDMLGVRMGGGGDAGGTSGGGWAGGGGVGDWDRGFHVLVGEEWARAKVPAWLTSLVHWCMCADNRTMAICMEPRVDNERFIQHLQYAGFAKEKQISFPHKQAWFCRLQRDAWEGPAL